MRFRVGETTVGGGTVLRHLEAGAGDHLVLLPGWSQTAELFDAQIAGLAGARHLLAIDHRGHGRSDPAPAGYHVHRLAADLREVLVARALDRVCLLGHSMGCAVIWAYLELYGADRVASLVLVDQMTCALRDPTWSDREARAAGATMDAAGLYGFVNALRGAGEDPRIEFLRSTTSDGIGAETLARMEEQSLRLERSRAADLLFDVATHDWRALVPRIDLPTLVVAGDSPNVPIESQMWIAAQVAGARFARVPGVGGGTHFPFLERPEEFNRIVASFLAEVGHRPAAS